MYHFLIILIPIESPEGIKEAHKNRNERPLATN
jgi:hypothetical protein